MQRLEILGMGGALEPRGAGRLPRNSYMWCFKSVSPLTIGTVLILVKKCLYGPRDRVSDTERETERVMQRERKGE